MQTEQRLNEEKQRLLQQNNLSSKSRSSSINTEGQNELNISGIPILFPFKPYDCQLIYMKKVIETLETGTSSLLESPTGTGKTLSLLCSILGWRYNLQNNYEKLKQFEMGGGGGISLNKRNGIPNIIYSTRTHTQLNQVVQELKCTAYNPKVAILGSREQLCVHPKVSLLKGSKQNTKCRSTNAPTSAKKCWYKQGTKQMDGITKTVLSSHILDVEDLHLIGKDQQFCPYYYSIDQCMDADIIFMPYNYLVNSSIRPPTVKINNSIVIFDEAHNIESVCCDSVSFELNSIQITQCINEVQSILELNKSDEDSMVSKDDLKVLKKILLKFEQVFENIDIPNNCNGYNNNNNYNEPSIVKEGKYIFDILSEADITKDTKDTIIDVAQDVLRELVTPDVEKNNSLTMSNNNQSNKYGLETFISALQTIFAGNFHSDSFKVNLSLKKLKTKSFMSSNTLTRTLSLWCFNPGIAISNIKNEVHAMILTSGTLSPLSSFSSELQIKFPIRLENKHLVNQKQIYVGVLEKGPCNKILSSEYNIRIQNDYMAELGNTLINIARRIPHGMLVFFASYQHMTNCVELWNKYRLGNLSMMEQLQKNKHVICEPRKGGQAAVKAVFKQYSEAINNKSGAILFAVMRGKISEGMDFSDNSARCVIICGIPYPFVKDPKIKAKRQYMDKQYAITNGNSINGQQWYSQQAIRAVNQAIGRIIRHRFDYGCVILADRRFALNRNQQNVSKWIKPYIKTVKNFGLLTRDLTLFFKNAKEFDIHMKKNKNNNENDKFQFIKIKRQLENNTKLMHKNEINDVFDKNGLLSNQNKNNFENKFKKNTRKRKYSDTLGKISQFVTSPMDTPGGYYNKRRKIGIAYELNDAMPTQFDTLQNNPNISNISKHGNTPTSTQKLKRKMFAKQLQQCSQITPNTQIENAKKKEINKMRARKLRIQNSNVSQTQQCLVIHNANKRRKTQNKVLENIKKELTKQEYKTFKSVLKLLNHMKNSQNENEFDENVVTPFRALFSVNITRRNLMKDLKRYIPKQFVDYYIRTLIPNHGKNNKNKNKTRGVLSQNLINTPAPGRMIQLSMPQDKQTKKPKKIIHDSLDENYIKLRKLQNKNADLSQPFDQHKFARRNNKPLVRNKTGYERMCCTLMSNDNYEKFGKLLKDWRGINYNDINVKTNKKRVLKTIVDLFIENCKDDMKQQNISRFTSLTCGFDKLLSKKEDKTIWHNLILTAKKMTEQWKEVRQNMQPKT